LISVRCLWPIVGQGRQRLGSVLVNQFSWALPG